MLVYRVELPDGRGPFSGVWYPSHRRDGSEVDIIAMVMGFGDDPWYMDFYGEEEMFALGAWSNHNNPDHPEFGRQRFQRRFHKHPSNGILPEVLDRWFPPEMREFLDRESGGRFQLVAFDVPEDRAIVYKCNGEVIFSKNDAKIVERRSLLDLQPKVEAPMPLAA